MAVVRGGKRSDAGYAVAFAVSYTQAPHFWSNQHQYFLHGLAAAGLGFLGDDWLAQTTDPTPVFSGFVAIVGQYLPFATFQMAYFAILAAYFLSFRRLLDILFGADRAWRGISLAALIVAHSAALRVASALLFGKDYPWFVQSGVAGQYVLGFGLQPSVAGVCLLFGVVAFAELRPARAAAWMALSAVFHATYLLSAAMFVAGCLAELARRGQWRIAAVCGCTALGVVAPAVAYVASQFLGSDPEVGRTAREILYTVRIPHHCQPGRWLDWIAALQVAWTFAGLSLIAWSPAGRVCLVVALFGALGTILQWLTDNHTLALLFPWRVSVVLLPIATAVLFDRFARWAGRAPRASVAARAAVLVSVVGGLAVTWSGAGYAVNRAEDGILRHVAGARQRGQVYLLPVRIPALQSAARGSVSMTFVGPPTVQSGLILIDFQRWRLESGTPVYVDFKSIPYRDDEVIEWLRRMRNCERWYESLGDERTRIEMLDAGITHVVMTNGAKTVRPAGETIYTDDHYTIIKIKGD